jgi:hypothetical protein
VRSTRCWADVPPPPPPCAVAAVRPNCTPAPTRGPAHLWHVRRHRHHADALERVAAEARDPRRELLLWHRAPLPGYPRPVLSQQALVHRLQPKHHAGVERVALYSVTVSEYHSVTVSQCQVGGSSPARTPCWGRTRCPARVTVVASSVFFKYSCTRGVRGGARRGGARSEGRHRGPSLKTPSPSPARTPCWGRTHCPVQCCSVTVSGSGWFVP